jgi:two-component system phosphate regulon sensor histidine kinase PhoR
MLYYAVPVNLKYTNGNGSVLRLSIALRDIELLTNKLYQYVIIDMIFGIFVGIIVAYFYTRSISKPIGEMVKTSKYIAQGNFETKLEVNTNDEFAVLGASFNFMVDALNNLIMELKSRNSEIESILNSMITGVIGIDVNHKILYINPMAKKWFNVDYENFKGKNILDIVRSSRLDKAIVDVLDKNRKNLKSVVIQNGDRYYKIYINLMKFEEKAEGAVIVIQDVTEEKNYSEMKTEFVANVSHELKTPLTSIMGFIETLKDVEIDDIETRDKFLGIIESEAKRLQNIINDLLDISYLENSRAKPESVELTEFKVGDLINDVVLILSKASLTKKIKIQQYCDENIVFTANRDKLKQLFINLVDNAIKYNVTNGKVSIRANETETDLIISVEDTGIGIPKEHIDRLFERFYRVDKSRSRAQGGTGLGLAIVKHIVMSMNGKVEVISEVGKGTKFIVSLPKIAQPK